MGFFDFRGAHITFAASAIAVVCTVVNDMSGLSSAAGASPTAAAALGGASQRSGGWIRMVNNMLGSGGGSNTFLGLAIRVFSLPLAWPALMSLFCLISYSRMLERRFSSPRFGVLLAFLGGSAAVLHRALIAVTAPTTASGAPSSTYLVSNSSAWHAIIISLATLVALRIRLAPRRPNAAAATIAQQNNHENRFGAVANSTDPRAAFPVLLSTLAAGLGSYASFSLIFGRGAGGAVSQSTRDTLAAAGCALLAGAVPAALVHFYQPLLSMLNSVADAAPVRGLLHRLLYSGGEGGLFHVRQFGAERAAQEAMRAGQDNDANDEQLRAAIRASLGPQGAASNTGGGAGATGGGADEVRVLAAGGADPRRRGVNPDRMVFAAAAAPAAAAPRPQAAAPPTPTEREALQFLREIAPRASDQAMLAVLRTCRGDANAAAALLLEGAG